MVIAASGFLALQPALKQVRVNGAYNLTIQSMRRARQMAVDNRKTYILNFVAPDTIQLSRQDGGTPLPAPVLIQTWRLQNGIQFLAVPGIPSTVNTTPDGFGTGARAIDFSIGVGAGGGTSIYFKPDGAAYDVGGNTNSGTLYLASPNDLYSSRAVTLFGITGRLRGWRLLRSANNQPSWSQL